MKAAASTFVLAPSETLAAIRKEKRKANKRAKKEEKKAKKLLLQQQELQVARTGEQNMLVHQHLCSGRFVTSTASSRQSPSARCASASRARGWRAAPRYWPARR